MNDKGINEKNVIIKFNANTTVNNLSSQKKRLRFFLYRLYRHSPYYALGMMLLSISYIIDAQTSSDLLKSYLLNSEFSSTFGIEWLEFVKPIIFFVIGYSVLVIYITAKIIDKATILKIMHSCTDIFILASIGITLNLLGIYFENKNLTLYGNYYFLWLEISYFILFIHANCRTVYFKFKYAVKDPKDRYNIVMIFLGVMISLIALFK